MKKEAGAQVKGIAGQLSIIGAQLIPVVSNPKFAMGV